MGTLILLVHEIFTLMKLAPDVLALIALLLSIAITASISTKTCVENSVAGPMMIQIGWTIMGTPCPGCLKRNTSKVNPSGFVLILTLIIMGIWK